MAELTIYFGDNLPILQGLPADSVDLIYIDPPFNTGKVQRRTRLSTIRDDHGDRTGFQGKRYRTIKLGTKEYTDIFDDYLAFLEPRLEEARRVLKANGSLFFHIDYREVHYAKVLLDSIFGRDSFLNEIIWAYDYGARSKTKWPAKHDNILWYAKNPEDYHKDRPLLLFFDIPQKLHSQMIIYRHDTTPKGTLINRLISTGSSPSCNGSK